MFYRFSLILIPAVFFLFIGEGAVAKEKIKIFDAASNQIIEVEKIQKTDAEWKKILTPEQFRITRLKGTEKPFGETCPLPPKGQSGIYQCVACGTDLFRYESKFESGTGWPSFWEPVSPLNILFVPDNSLGMRRTEVICSRCEAHLGHVFDDGPPPTGKRFCINTMALKLAMLKKPGKTTEKATFAAGCFWGVEAAFRELKGVVSVKSGYTGGTLPNPTYEQVCSHKTGHAEAVEIEFDHQVVSYLELLDFFWSIHDPATLNRQGYDIGDQYRSAIFYHNPEQAKMALQIKEKLDKSDRFKKPIVTEIKPTGPFYIAEEYHQRYYEKKGIKPTCHIPERLQK